MSAPQGAPCLQGTHGIATRAVSSKPTDRLLDRGALSVSEFCEWAGIGRSTFYREVAAGSITVRKIGRKSIVASDEALRWLNELPTNSNSEAA